MPNCGETVGQRTATRQRSGAGTMRVVSISTPYLLHATQDIHSVTKGCGQREVSTNLVLHRTKTCDCYFDDHGLLVKALALGMRQCGVAAR